ncbi:hypothetical protein I4F81_000223 [Pyropia yezoensis]|uniref:Uncharacterized protein n=1 Tax=Pyropia yezoensis TaxID=2788 RepID=A0ACC3BJD7_PYRYE|nr:hypothetical protein I4F81_000223 [Neopyropia yezoensis]
MNRGDGRGGEDGAGDGDDMDFSHRLSVTSSLGGDSMQDPRSALLRDGTFLSAIADAQEAVNTSGAGVEPPAKSAATAAVRTYMKNLHTFQQEAEERERREAANAATAAAAAAGNGSPSALVGSPPGADGTAGGRPTTVGGDPAVGTGGRATARRKLARAKTFMNTRRTRTSAEVVPPPLEVTRVNSDEGGSAVAPGGAASTATPSDTVAGAAAGGPPGGGPSPAGPTVAVAPSAGKKAKNRRISTSSMGSSENSGALPSRGGAPLAALKSLRLGRGASEASSADSEPSSAGDTGGRKPTKRELLGISRNGSTPPSQGRTPRRKMEATVAAVAPDAASTTSPVTPADTESSPAAAEPAALLSPAGDTADAVTSSTAGEAVMEEAVAALPPSMAAPAESAAVTSIQVEVEADPHLAKPALAPSLAGEDVPLAPPKVPLSPRPVIVDSFQAESTEATPSRSSAADDGPSSGGRKVKRSKSRKAKGKSHALEASKSMGGDGMSRHVKLSTAGSVDEEATAASPRAGSRDKGGAGVDAPASPKIPLAKRTKSFAATKSFSSSTRSRGGSGNATFSGLSRIHGVNSLASKSFGRSVGGGKGGSGKGDHSAKASGSSSRKGDGDGKDDGTKPSTPANAGDDAADPISAGKPRSGASRKAASASMGSKTFTSALSKSRSKGGGINEGNSLASKTFGGRSRINGSNAAASRSMGSGLRRADGGGRSKGGAAKDALSPVSAVASKASAAAATTPTPSRINGRNASASKTFGGRTPRTGGTDGGSIYGNNKPLVASKSFAGVSPVASSGGGGGSAASRKGFVQFPDGSRAVAPGYTENTRLPTAEEAKAQGIAAAAAAAKGSSGGGGGGVSLPRIASRRTLRPDASASSSSRLSGGGGGGDSGSGAGPTPKLPKSKTFLGIRFLGGGSVAGGDGRRGK